MLPKSVARIGGDFEEFRGGTDRGATIDANRLDDLIHFQSKGPSPWPSISISLIATLMAGKRAHGQVSAMAVRRPAPWSPWHSRNSAPR